MGVRGFPGSPAPGRVVAEEGPAHHERHQREDHEEDGAFDAPRCGGEPGGPNADRGWTAVAFELRSGGRLPSPAPSAPTSFPTPPHRRKPGNQGVGCSASLAGLPQPPPIKFKLTRSLGPNTLWRTSAGPPPALHRRWAVEEIAPEGAAQEEDREAEKIQCLRRREMVAGGREPTPWPLPPDSGVRPG